MIKHAHILIPALLAFFLLADPASATWLLYNGSDLEDENGDPLEQFDMIQLIYSPDATLGDPNPLDGMPTGNDVLWDSTTVDADGDFSGSVEFDNALVGDYVFIRFFNSDTMGTVTYYGVLGPHELRDIAGFDLWDTTPLGTYIWSIYPFTVIPEPPTWLVLLPAGLAGAVIFRRSKKRRHVNPLNRR